MGEETNMDNSRKAIYVNVTNLLHEIGIPAHIVGHDYIRHAIVSACENPALLKNITKHLYVKVAIYYDTSVYSVEKGIRNAIEVALEDAKVKNKETFRPYKHKPRPEKN